MKTTTLGAALALAGLVLAALPASAGDGQDRKPPEERWNQLDTDADGSVSRAEAEAGAPGLARNFERFDADRDGRITREEMQAARAERHEQMRARAEERWQSADANGDGSIDLAEAQAGMPRAAEDFGRLDADGNGLLSREELREAMREHRAARMQRGPGEGGRNRPQ